MRLNDILTEKKQSIPKAVAAMTDEERGQWIVFLQSWLQGTVMQKVTAEHVARWEAFARLFPTGLVAPIRLYRVVTLPIGYANLKTFHLKTPAPGPVGSWTSTKIGCDTVAGVAADFAERNGLVDTTCRIAIESVIQPQNVLATIKTMKLAFLSLTHDYNQEDYEVPEITVKDGVKCHRYTYKPYLGQNPLGFHDDLDYYRSLYRDMPGGPYRQSEHIVHTTPVDAKVVYIYRKGREHLRLGHDDPHSY